MAGLDPAIHGKFGNVDARVKPAHDGAKRLCRPCQPCFGQPRIVLHLRFQGLYGVKFQFGAQPVDKIHFNFLTIEVAGKVKEKALQQRRAIVKGRAAAIGGDAIISGFAHPHLHGINAVAQPAGGVHFHIGGGHVQCAADLLPLDDSAQRKKRVAEQVRRYRQAYKDWLRDHPGETLD